MKRVTITVNVTGTQTLVAEVDDGFEASEESIWDLIHSGEAECWETEVEASGHPEWWLDPLEPYVPTKEHLDSAARPRPVDHEEPK